MLERETDSFNPSRLKCLSFSSPNSNFAFICGLPTYPLRAVYSVSPCIDLLYQTMYLSRKLFSPPEISVSSCKTKFSETRAETLMQNGVTEKEDRLDIIIKAENHN